MPGKKHLRGASAKEQRQYGHILESAKKEGRYGRRAREVAARTVMKQHSEEGHEPHRPASSSRGTRRSSGPSTRRRGGTTRRRPGSRSKRG